MCWADTQFVIFLLNIPHTRIFSCHGCVNTHTHHTQTRSTNLSITQRVAPCGNRTRYTLSGSRLVAQAPRQPCNLVLVWPGNTKVFTEGLRI
ncbi:hypothetical protein SFRURICE_006506 [Spodoptera frugiperda]|nr:hypothetical protein SFRURICE_006506 [Spodoptera frugiperda]